MTRATDSQEPWSTFASAMNGFLSQLPEVMRDGNATLEKMTSFMVEKRRLQSLFMWEHIAGSSLDSVCHTLALLSALGDNKMTRS